MASDFTDAHGEQVHDFAVQAANLGLSRLAELLVSMFESGVWRDFRDGTGRYTFLEGEFDYFLTQQGVSREQVIHGVRDIEVKARLEAAMDERRTGEPGYRRRLQEIRNELPNRPGRPIEPFGYGKAEAKVLGTEVGRREPLGSTVRRWTRSGGKPPAAPAPPLFDRLARAVPRLDDSELDDLVAVIRDEKLQRRRQVGRRDSRGAH